MELDSNFPKLSLLTHTLANLVYKDLSNDERLSSIQPQFEDSLEQFYLSAQNLQDQQVAYIPLQHSKDIDFELISAMQQKLSNSIIYMAIADNTGNILYYQFTAGCYEK